MNFNSAASIIRSSGSTISAAINKAASTLTRGGYKPSSEVGDTLRLNKIKPLSARETLAINKRALIHVRSGSENGATLRFTPSDNHQVRLARGMVIIDNDKIVSLSMIQRILSDEELRRMNPKIKKAVQELFEDCTTEYLDRREAIGNLKKTDKKYQKALNRSGISNELASKYIGVLRDNSSTNYSNQERLQFLRFKEEYDNLKSAIIEFEKTVEDEDP